MYDDYVTQLWRQVARIVIYLDPFIVTCTLIRLPFHSALDSNYIIRLRQDRREMIRVENVKWNGTSAISFPSWNSSHHFQDLTRSVPYSMMHLITVTFLCPRVEHICTCMYIIENMFYILHT